MVDVIQCGVLGWWIAYIHACDRSLWTQMYLHYFILCFNLGLLINLLNIAQLEDPNRPNCGCRYTMDKLHRISLWSALSSLIVLYLAWFHSPSQGQSCRGPSWRYKQLNFTCPLTPKIFFKEKIHDRCFCWLYYWKFIHGGICM